MNEQFDHSDSQSLTEDHLPGNRTYVVTQLAIGAYRQDFLDCLAELNVTVRFLCGLSHFDPTVRTAVNSKLVDARARNVFGPSRAVAFQRQVLREAVNADVAVVEFNPRIISNWSILLVRRVLRRPTLLWGHAWSRSGPGSRSEVIRRAMRSLGVSLMVYTPEDRAATLTRYRDARVTVVPNSLYRCSDLEPMNGGQNDIVFCARMVPSKRPRDALVAFRDLIADHELIRNLIYIGDGPERPSLERAARNFGLESRVRFLGSVTDVTSLRQAYRDALCAVSPGYVGLNATQALGFGVPLIYSSSQPHAPEVSLLDNSNSIEYEGSAQSLRRAIEMVIQDAPKWRRGRPQIARETRGRYSAEVMAAAFAGQLRAWSSS